MSDVRVIGAGVIGEGTWFSDLFAKAVRESITGRIFVQCEQGEAHAFYRAGNPVHASGSALMHGFIGEVLIQTGLIGQEQVEQAYAAQQGGDHELIGQILLRTAGLQPDQIDAVIRQQTAMRTSAMFAISRGRWQIDESSFPEVDSIAIPLDGLPLLLFSLRANSTDEELRAISDTLLGNAVQLKATPGQIEALAPSDTDRKLLQLLEKPRKVHQLEQAGVDRRSVRALLKTLHLLKYLSLHPHNAGVAIKEAVKAAIPGAPTPMATPAISNPPPIERKETPKPAARPQAARVEPPIAGELRTLHAKLATLSYFELLGVKENVNAVELRLAFTQLAKKYHPDALGTGISQELSDIARAVSAALNEAHNVLADDERRAKYLQQVKQGTGGQNEEQVQARAGGARVKFEMAAVFLKRQDFKKAREHFRFAMDLAPSNGLYKATYAWSMFSDPGFDRKEAMEKGLPLLTEAMKLSPNEANVHYYAARFFKERGEMGAAEEAFKRAVRLDPKHTEAARELRLMMMRSKKEESTGSSGGAFSKLFKK